jgi:hypothetical protein
MTRTSYSMALVQEHPADSSREESLKYFMKESKVVEVSRIPMLKCIAGFVVREREERANCK